MNKSWLLSGALLLCGALAPVAPALAQAREEARLITATQVLDELREQPDQNVPAWLMQRAYGIAVIPEVIKGAFLVGGRYGKGVLTVRGANGHFSDPIFIDLAGGSFGWQLGATSTDVVLIFTSQRGVENFAGGKFTLGADASVAAGPVGRQGEAAAGINAEIYSYSRARGLFAGVALDGTVLAFDRTANDEFYGHEEVTTSAITSGAVTTNAESAHRFLTAIATSASGGETTEATATQPAPAQPEPQAAPPAPAPSSGARTFPLADPKPGGEPQQ
jgi:lipid-binding SYLF domain-containing protein